jgi:hypothetical protein
MIINLDEIVCNDCLTTLEYTFKDHVLFINPCHKCIGEALQEVQELQNMSD